jgi:hypothetical protein
MRLRRPQNLAGKLTAGAAVVVLVLFLGSFALFGLSFSSSSSEFGGDGVSRAQLRSLKLGTSRDDIEARIGEGEDALGHIETGVALEPSDADCLYYMQTPSNSFGNIVQLCFRDDVLVRKQAYMDPLG